MITRRILLCCRVIELPELLHGVFIDWVDHVEEFEALLTERLQERRRGDLRNAVTCDVVDVIVALLHVVYVLLEANLLITRLGDVVAHELCKLGAVGRIFMDSQFYVLGDLLVELLAVICPSGILPTFPSTFLFTRLHSVGSLLDAACPTWVACSHLSIGDFTKI